MLVKFFFMFMLKVNSESRLPPSTGEVWPLPSQKTLKSGDDQTMFNHNRHPRPIREVEHRGDSSNFYKKLSSSQRKTRETNTPTHLKSYGLSIFVDRRYPKQHLVFNNSIRRYTVSGQNTIGICITPLVSIQYTAQKQNIVCNNQLLNLQPAVSNKML